MQLRAVRSSTEHVCKQINTSRSELHSLIDVFWNYHVPTLDTYNNKTADYTGRGNVTYFLDLAAAYDLFVIWRIGPYICAEWPGGGM